MTHTKDEALKLAKSWFETNTYGDEAVEVYEAIEQALAAPVQPVPWSQALESVWAEPDDTPPAAQPAVQEPVARVSLQWLAEMILSDCGHSSNYTPLLDRVKARIEQWERANSAPTPPAAQPAVPDALNPKNENPAYAAGWNDCRQAMLKGMKP
jgi:hypothetical protein